MKILQINTVYKTGGSTGRIVYDLKNVIESEGIEAYVAFGYGYSPVADESEKLFRIDTKTELLISKIRTKLIGHHGFDNIPETKRLLEWIKKIKPDIIHLHNIHNHYVNIGLLLKYIATNNIPCILTMHDCWTFTGHCAYFDFSGCDKWKTECRKCHSLHDYPKTFTPIDPSSWNYKHKRDLFSPLNITFVTPSRWLAGLVQESFLKDKSCKIINNGIDTDIFKPCGAYIKHKLGIDGKKMILAMASNFTKRKGIDYLLQIPTMLSDDEVLVLVGVKPEQQKILPKDKCIAINRTNNVTELAEYYSASDVFINTTLEDNFPTTNIEALSCGTPIVTFDTGGSSEAVLDDEEIQIENDIKYTSVGAVVPTIDISSMLIAIRKIINTGKIHYSKACASKAQMHYDKIKQYNKYIDLYKKILEEKKN